MSGPTPKRHSNIAPVVDRLNHVRGPHAFVRLVVDVPVDRGTADAVSGLWAPDVLVIVATREANHIDPIAYGALVVSVDPIELDAW